MIRTSLSRGVCLSLSAAVVCWFAVSPASAQSLFGSGGALGQTGRPQASGAFGGGGGLARSTRPASGFTSAFGGGSQLGGASSLNTSSLNAQSGVAGPQITTELGQLSSTIGQGGFVGRSDTAGRFVGNVMAGQQGVQGTNVGGFGGGGRGQFGGRGGGFNPQGNFNRTNQNRRTIRPQLRIGFEVTPIPAADVESNLATQMQRLETSRPELDGIEVQVGADRVAVLRGQVASEEDKKLAAMYVRLEPGVRDVRNELTVQGE